MLKIFERFLTKRAKWSCPVCFQNRFKSPKGVNVHIGHKSKTSINHRDYRVNSWRT
jgi:hypothetical protein